LTRSDTLDYYQVLVDDVGEVPSPPSTNYVLMMEQSTCKDKAAVTDKTTTDVEVGGYYHHDVCGVFITARDGTIITYS